MKFKTLIIGSVAAMALTAVTTATLPNNWNPVSTAQAAVDVNIGFSVFYDGLRDQGDWVSYGGTNVFIPINVDREWRPYTEGHWVHNRQYGWTWASDESFGWATYHYGRWGYARDIGWYWVPGNKWAPAWVSWRRGGKHVAWAPLPPRRGARNADVDISISIGERDIPDYYWVAVPTRNFLQVNLDVVIIKDDRERRRIIDQSEFAGTVNIENNTVINNVINVQYIEENTGKAVQNVEIKTVQNPQDAAQVKGQVVAVEGTLQADPAAKPPKVLAIEEVQQKAPTRGQQKADSAAPGAEPAQDQATQPATGEQPAAGQAAQGQQVPCDPAAGAKNPPDCVPATQAAKPGEKPATDQAAQPPATAPAEGQAAKPAEQPATDQAAQPKTEQPVNEQAAKPKNEQPVNEQAAKPKVEEPAKEQAAKPKVEEPAKEQAAKPKVEEPAKKEAVAPVEEQPAKTAAKKDKKAPVDGEAAAPEDQTGSLPDAKKDTTGEAAPANQAAEQPAKKKSAKKDQAEQPPAAADENVAKDKKAECDPAKEDCPAQ